MNSPKHLKKAERVRIEVCCSTKIHARQLQELERLGCEEVWGDISLCRDYIIKGLQRFLFVCLEEGIPLGQALVDLSVKGVKFDNGHPCQQRVSDLWIMLQERGAGTGRTEIKPIPPVSVPMATPIRAVNQEDNDHDGESDLEKDDWSGFAGVVGQGVQENK